MASCTDLTSILIVDDDETDRYLLRRMLKRAGIMARVFEASHGLAALQFFEGRSAREAEFPGEFPPSLVFLDINMPRLDGFGFLEAFREIRGRDGYESVDFVMFSSSNLEAERRRALEFDFVRGYITKMPPSSDQLKSHLVAAGVIAA